MVGGISGVGSFGMGYVSSFYQSRLAERVHNAQDARQAQQAQQQSPVFAARKAPAPETPVQPVSAALPVSRDEASVPELTSRLENDPAAMAGRMRTHYGDVSPEGRFVEAGGSSIAPDQSAAEDAENVLPNAEKPADSAALGQKAEAALPGQKEDAPSIGGEKAKSAQEALEEGECQTCEGRKYQDGSDDMGVSYQTPTNIKPEQAASAVRGHEMEHVYREQAKAAREGCEVVSQNVTMHTEICPECGKSYVSGGTTETVTRAKTDNSLPEDPAQETEEPAVGASRKPEGLGKTEKAEKPAMPVTAQKPEAASNNAQDPDAVKRSLAAQRDEAQQNAAQQAQKFRTPFSAIA